MSVAAPTQPDTQPSRSGRLLALVRKLIDYGKELAATVRQRVTSDPSFARTSFGTADLAVIFARIARAVLLARALEARVLSRAAWLDKGPGPRRARSTPRPKPLGPPPAETAADQITTGFDPVVRRRLIGAVIADICRDLGISGSHPLWREVQNALIQHGGSLARLIRDILNRTFRLPRRQQLATQAVLPAYPTPSGTGPP
jgi:hypothetical protein